MCLILHYAHGAQSSSDQAPIIPTLASVHSERAFSGASGSGSDQRPLARHGIVLYRPLKAQLIVPGGRLNIHLQSAGYISREISADGEASGGVRAPCETRTGGCEVQVGDVQVATADLGKRQAEVEDWRAVIVRAHQRGCPVSIDGAIVVAISATCSQHQSDSEHKKRPNFSHKTSTLLKDELPVRDGITQKPNDTGGSQ
jgi:hypothetical protein